VQVILVKRSGEPAVTLVKCFDASKVIWVTCFDVAKVTLVKCFSFSQQVAVKHSVVRCCGVVVMETYYYAKVDVGRHCVVCAVSEEETSNVIYDGLVIEVDSQEILCGFLSWI
jgi:hypothetical protein